MTDVTDNLAQVNPRVLEHRDELAATFQQAQPFRHIVIDDFFDTGYCQRLLDDFPTFQRETAIAEHGAVGGKSTRENIRELGADYQALDDLIQSQAFLDLVGTITGIPDLKYDPNYFGGGTHENLSGQDLNPHIDFNYHPLTRQHRRLNLIVYLNHEWQREWGGCIDFHRDPYLPPSEDQIISVLPLFNRCVIFETNEYSWHGFERIDLPEDASDVSRKSVALYYYTDTRPEAETAGEHSTIYVERHMSDHIVPGVTLSEQDYQQIQILMARRDQHLKMLYGNIRQLYQHVNSLQAAVQANTAPVSEAAEQQPTDDPRLATALERVRALESSTSWKLTAPLRALGRLLGRGG